MSDNSSLNHAKWECYLPRCIHDGRSLPQHQRHAEYASRSAPVKNTSRQLSSRCVTWCGKDPAALWFVGGAVANVAHGHDPT